MHKIDLKHWLNQQKGAIMAIIGTPESRAVGLSWKEVYFTKGLNPKP